MTESYEFPPFETRTTRVNGDSVHGPEVQPAIPLSPDLVLGGGRNIPQPAAPLGPAGPDREEPAHVPPAEGGPPSPDPVEQDGVRITLWGGSSSGKTTFLGVLPFAIQQARTNPRYGSWMLTPLDGRTRQFQTQEMVRLDSERVFAPSTSILEPDLRWRLRGRIHEGGAAGLRHGVRRALGREEEAKFSLRVPDVPGELFGAGHSAAEAGRGGSEIDEQIKERLTDELADSHGIVYLFDPTAERAAANSFSYLHEMLDRLKMRMEQQDRIRNNHLPHYIAVCVTKFDTKWILDRALEERLVRQDQHGQPSVPRDKAELFFDLLCRTLGPSGQNVSDAIKSSFDPKRTLYFVTSAVGFRRGANGAGYDLGEPSQINPSVGGVPRIMDQIRPINVFEPLVEIERLYRLGVHR